MSEKVLIAGCGDLGQRVARRLIERGDEVFALRRRSPDQNDASIRWLQADLTHAGTLSNLPAGITQLVYSPTPGAREPAAYRAIFVDGLRHVLSALSHAPLQRVLFVSSSAVYGEHGDEWVDEDTSPAPLGFNGRILLEAEHCLASQPVRSIVLRLAGLYGPGRMQVLERLRNGMVRAPHEPPHWANRMHVDDAAAAIAHVLSLEAPQPIYIGVDDTPLPLDDLYGFLARHVGGPPVQAGPAPEAVGSKRLSNARLRASGFRVEWPDSRAGYAALLDNA